MNNNHHWQDKSAAGSESAGGMRKATTNRKSGSGNGSGNGSGCSLIQCANCGGRGHVYRICNHPITSFGVICYRLRPQLQQQAAAPVPEYMLVQRKDSLSYVEFVRGKYSLQNRGYIVRLLANMTGAEREKIRTVASFDELWYGFWQTDHMKSFMKSYMKEYEQSMVRFDMLRKGFLLRCSSASTSSCDAAAGQGQAHTNTHSHAHARTHTITTDTQGQDQDKVHTGCCADAAMTVEETETETETETAGADGSAVVATETETGFETGADGANTPTDAKQSAPGLIRFDLSIALEASAPPRYNETEWGFPKGRRNINETDLRCACREFKEETGVDMSDIHIMAHVKPFEEIFTGSNKVRYRHVYYLAHLKQRTTSKFKAMWDDGCSSGGATPNVIKVRDTTQMREIANVGWFDFQGVCDRIREENVERRQMFRRVHQWVMQNECNKKNNNAMPCDDWWHNGGA